MLSYNSGYYGYQRSIRSQEAIDGFEVPISLINKDMITNYLAENHDEYSDEQLAFLKTVPVKVWRETAKRSEATSWHHTSTWFNETKHYSLGSVALRILKMQEADLNNPYKPRPRTKKEKEPEKYGFLVSQLWGGTRNYPKIVGYEKVYGRVKGDWLTCEETKTRFKVNANKTVKYFETTSLEEAKKMKEECK